MTVIAWWYNSVMWPLSAIILISLIMFDANKTYKHVTHGDPDLIILRASLMIRDSNKMTLSCHYRSFMTTGRICLWKVYVTPMIEGSCKVLLVRYDIWHILSVNPTHLCSCRWTWPWGRTSSACPGSWPRHCRPRSPCRCRSASVPECTSRRHGNGTPRHCTPPPWGARLQTVTTNNININRAPTESRLGRWHGATWHPRWVTFCCYLTACRNTEQANAITVECMSERRRSSVCRPRVSSAHRRWDVAITLPPERVWPF